MTKRQREHLKSRDSKPFNINSKTQENTAAVAANKVWETIIDKYPNLSFNNLNTLGLKGLDVDFALEYINRGLGVRGLPKRQKDSLQALKSSSGIRPDGGVFFVESKNGDFNHIICSLEVKHQGEYDGYTPESDSAWKRRGKDFIPREERPPQAQGNAIERFAKNANAIRTLTSFYGYNPYIVMCEGFDFHLKEDFHKFKHQKHANKYEGRDSSILMRLIAGNDWLPLNKVYVNCVDHGNTKICPATIFARMPKWEAQEISDVMLEVIDQAIEHLKKIDEIE